MFDRYYREAIKVAERLGTWVLYAVRGASDLDHLIGYMVYTVEDLEVIRRRAVEDRRLHYSQLVGYWRRAIRWVSSLDRANFHAISERLITELEAHPEHSALPYYVPDTGHRTLTARDRPQRKAGRPRTRPVAERRVSECGRCRGFGYLETG